MAEFRNGGPRVEEDLGKFWLTWEEDVDGFMWKWKQRPLSFAERILWRLFRRVPRPSVTTGATSSDSKLGL